MYTVNYITLYKMTTIYYFFYPNKARECFQRKKQFA